MVIRSGGGAEPTKKSRPGLASQMVDIMADTPSHRVNKIDQEVAVILKQKAGTEASKDEMAFYLSLSEESVMSRTGFLAIRASSWLEFDHSVHQPKFYTKAHGHGFACGIEFTPEGVIITSLRKDGKEIDVFEMQRLGQSEKDWVSAVASEISTVCKNR